MTDNCLDDSLCLTTLKVINTLGGSCERTKIQKALYFLGVLYSPDLDVKPSFSFLHYGPYSRDVETALDRLELHGYIVAKRPIQRCEYETVFVSTAWGKRFASGSLQDISKVLGLLKGMSPRELEIISTIHFVWTVHARKEEDERWEIVAELKPSTRPCEICKYLGQLTSRGYLQ